MTNQPTKKLNETVVGVILVVFATAFFHKDQYGLTFFSLVLIIILLKLKELTKLNLNSKDGNTALTADFTLKEILEKNDNFLDVKTAETVRVKGSADIDFQVNEYVIEVTQVGGVNSHLLTKIAYVLEDGGVYLNPPDPWVRVSFNRGGDVMWISGKKGYRIDEFSSPTGNQILSDSIDIGSCGILLEDRLKNEIRVICSIKNKMS